MAPNSPKIGELCVDSSTGTVWRGSRSARLSKRTFAMFLVLWRRPKRPKTYDQLRASYHVLECDRPKRVCSQVYNLRQRLAPLGVRIVNIWSEGSFYLSLDPLPQ